MEVVALPGTNCSGGDSSNNLIKFGPVGILATGEPWDVQIGLNEPVKIFISFNNSGIRSLQFVYSQNGVQVASEKHGGGGGNIYHAVKINSPNEYIKSISGTFSDDCIASITFTTNLRTIGPLGNGTGYPSPFEYQLGDEGQFRGFFGTADGHCIRSIGVYVNPTTSTTKEPDVVHGRRFGSAW